MEGDERAGQREVERGAVAGGEQGAADGSGAQRLAGGVGERDVERDAQTTGGAADADGEGGVAAARCTRRYAAVAAAGVSSSSSESARATSTSSSRGAAGGGDLVGELPERLEQTLGAAGTQQPHGAAEGDERLLHGVAGGHRVCAAHGGVGRVARDDERL